jgi:hypothetical protein
MKSTPLSRACAFLITVFVGLILGHHACAHELPANRVTLVLRESNQIALTLHIPYLEVLHKTLLPEQSFEAFIVMHSSMAPNEFKKSLVLATQKLQTTFQLTTKASKNSTPINLRTTHWRWPDPEKTQATLKQRAMQMAVAPKDHSHEPSIEVYADAISTTKILTVQVSIPDALQPALLVSYRPKQVWINSKSVSNTVNF